ncbi:MAG: hypothetical protein OEZ06_03980 [Myxococcales bacterium]|nr:hypothetical protein [Myxococcales bacterium]
MNPTNRDTTTRPSFCTPHRHHRFKALFVAFAAVALLDACGDNQGGGAEVGSLGFVGTVDGTNAFVSVIVTDSGTGSDEAIVYICDGEAELREWLQGTVADRTSFERSNDAKSVVKVALVETTMTGEFIDSAGTVHAFDTVEATGEAGLYIVDDEEAAAQDIWAAWVVDNDGNERGAFLQSGLFSSTPLLASTTFNTVQFSTVGNTIGSLDDREASSPSLSSK